MQSKEYKYNRQAFDLKARSMTEKYARAGASENHSGNQHITSHSNVDMVRVNITEVDTFTEFRTTLQFILLNCRWRLKDQKVDLRLTCLLEVVKSYVH